jgi:hypothetical protein
MSELLVQRARLRRKLNKILRIETVVCQTLGSRRGSTQHQWNLPVYLGWRGRNRQPAM